MRCQLAIMVGKAREPSEAGPARPQACEPVVKPFVSLDNLVCLFGQSVSDVLSLRFVSDL